jgi:uncharacterized membrane protein YdbT with pleckstrin-like domain
MSYLSRRLASGETIVHEGRFHWIQCTLPWLALLVLGILVIGVFIWIAEIVRLSTTRMIVTNRRVLLKKGFFTIQVDELILDSIEGAHIDQSIFGRIFGYGKLILRGRGDTHVEFPTMDRPSRFRAAIEDVRMHAEVRPVEVRPHESEPPLDETRNERRRRERRERHEAERERRHAH